MFKLKVKKTTKKSFQIENYSCTQTDANAHMLWSFGNHHRCQMCRSVRVISFKMLVRIQLVNGAHRHRSSRVCPFAWPRRPSPLRLLQRHVEIKAALSWQHRKDPWPHWQDTGSSSPSAHCSKNPFFVQKFIITTFSRVFHPKFFLTIFLVKSKLSIAKKSKTTTFSRVFHPKKKSTIFSGN